MGSIMRVFTAGAEHIMAQSQIDAARITQAASNAAKLSVVESQKIVQQANNAASTMYAAANTRVQTANNTAAAQIASARRKLQTVYNDQAVLVAAAKERLRLANNDAAAARSSLANWHNSRQNKQLLEAGGRRVNSITSEMMSLIDQSAGRDIAARLASAETLGAAMSQAAAAGVGTSFMDQLQGTVNLREALESERANRELKSRLQAGAEARAQAMGDTVNSLSIGQDWAELDFTPMQDERDYTAILNEQDYTPIIAEQDYTAFTADLDYTVYVDHKKQSLGSRLFTLGASAVATYFGGPAAGMAVSDSMMAIHDMNNGNFSAARQGFDNAFRNANTGWNTFRADTKNGGSGTAWGANVFKSAGAFLKIG